MSLKTTVTQLLREFWLPLVLGAGWTFYDAYANPEHRTAARIIPIFSASFFLLSWLSGQVVRVRRQARVEGGLMMWRPGLM